MLLKVVRGLIDRRAAVQVVDDKLPERFLFLGDDADAALFVAVKDEIIQNDTAKVRAENTQHHGFPGVDKRRRERHAHACQRHGSSKLDSGKSTRF